MLHHITLRSIAFTVAAEAAWRMSTRSRDDSSAPRLAWRSSRLQLPAVWGCSRSRTSYQYTGPIFPAMLLQYHTPQNRPQHDIGNYLGPFSRVRKHQKFQETGARGQPSRQRSCAVRSIIPVTPKGQGFHIGILAGFMLIPV